MAKNGPHRGGRPKGCTSNATLKARLQREYLVEQFERNLGPIVSKAIADAIQGNKEARQWLTDRAWGRANQTLDITTNGKDLPSLSILSNDKLEAIAAGREG
jgi:hypothetical protein